MSTYSSRVTTGYGTNLLAYWQLNETSGTTFTDSGPNGLTLTMASPNPTLNQQSLLRSDSYATGSGVGSAHFSSGAYASMSSNSHFNSLTSLTIAGWAMVGNVSQISTVGALLQSTGQMALYIGSDYGQTPSLAGMSSYGMVSGTQTSNSINDTIGAKCPAFIVLTYDGSFMRLYINGMLQTMKALTGTVTGGAEIGLGASASGVNAFTGYLQHLGVWGATSGTGGALADSQIKDLYIYGTMGAYPGSAGTTYGALVYPWSTNVLVANSSRRRVTFTNDSEAIIWLTLGSAGLPGVGIPLLPSGGKHTLSEFTGPVYAAHAWLAGFQNLCIMEE